MIRRNARHRRPAAAADGAPAVPALTFANTGGALVAVVSLCGGAGASTLTALVGRAAARASRAPVLVCDPGGPTAGLADYLRAECRLTLASASSQLAAGGTPARSDLVTVVADGLRVMASAPATAEDSDEAVVDRLLDDARAAHAITLVDCGLLTRPVERRALERATHVLWVLPATVNGTWRARRRLDALAPAPPGREIVVARHDPRERRAAMGELTALAADRGAPLVLMPDVGDLANSEAAVHAAIEKAEVTLQAIGELMRR